MLQISQRKSGVSPRVRKVKSRKRTYSSDHQFTVHTVRFDKIIGISRRSAPLCAFVDGSRGSTHQPSEERHLPQPSSDVSTCGLIVVGNEPIQVPLNALLNRCGWLPIEDSLHLAYVSRLAQCAIWFGLIIHNAPVVADNFLNNSGQVGDRVAPPSGNIQRFDVAEKARLLG